MQDQDSGQPLPPKTLPFDGNEFNRNPARRLTHLLEEYEASLRVVQERRAQGLLREDTFHEAMADKRTKFIEHVLHEYAEECAVGPGYYENLVYSVLKTRINVHDGVKRAMERLDHDVRDVNNAHGATDAELDVDSFEDLVGKLNELWTLKMLLSGFGLDNESEYILKEVSLRMFGPRKPVTVTTQRG